MDPGDSSPAGPPAPLALVADDQPDHRLILSRLLTKQGYAVVQAADGTEAIRLEAERRPVLVLLDVDMPGASGLDVLREIRRTHPEAAVVMVTASDDPEVARTALDLGAVDFIRKPYDAREVRFVAERVRAALTAETGGVLPSIRSLREGRTSIEVGVDLSMISRVVAFLGQDLELHFPGVQVPSTEIKLALYEALANAVEHGSLEITYDEKTRALADDAGIGGLIRERAASERCRGRKVVIEVTYEPERVVYRITDPGQGFRHASIHEDKALGSTTALHGRGILLISHYMDEVRWNERGNEVTLIRGVRGARPRRRKGRSDEPGSGSPKATGPGAS